MNKIKFDYIIYHKNCLDGFSGFLVAHLSGRLTRNVEIYADVPSTNKIPLNINNKNIIIIDVAYKKEILEEIFSRAKSVVFIDHHVSIHNDVMDLVQDTKYKEKVTIVYDVARSGAVLAWKYFYPTRKIPLFLKYVEDQDTGKWQYENTKPFIYAVKTYYDLNHNSNVVDKWYELLNKKKVFKLIRKGKIMQDYNDFIVTINLSKHSMEHFPSDKIYDDFPTFFEKSGQYKVAVFNGTGCPSITEIGLEAVTKLECDFCMIWTLNLEKKEYVVSMRSKKTNVAEIAKLFGGGGHELAASFSFPSSKYRMEVDFFK